MTSTLSADLRASMVKSVLAGADEAQLMAEVCDGLVQAGVPLSRVALAGDLLDPTFDGQGVRWKRGEGATRSSFLRNAGDGSSEDWRRSPFFPLVEGGVDRIRRRLDASYVPGEFPVLDEFRGRGATDYVAMIVRVGGAVRLGETNGVTASWLTDAPGGFDDAQLDLIADILPTLAAMFLWQSTRLMARTLVTTYLGRDAADRVLAGDIVRGKASRIQAVVWFSDLVGFTRITDGAAADVVMAMLNDYAEAQVDAIERNGGHVLKFIGDGLLAIFPNASAQASCVRALDAAVELRSRIRDLNLHRRDQGLPVTDTHLALHLGELLYGNIGGPRRLDFTVLGAAVNEASRIVAISGSLDQSVIVSTAFAEAAGAARSRLVSLGRYAMKGVARPQELYTLDVDQLALSMPAVPDPRGPDDGP